MPIQAQKPGDSQEGVYNPSPQQPLVFEAFKGINTSTTRPGVPDDAMAWCDGWFTLGPRLLRTLWGIGAKLWTVPSGTLSFFDFANISTAPVMIAITSLGGIWQINTATAVATQIAANGTIINPSLTNVGISQWGSQYVLIVANQTNGYWIWDGTVLYQAGTLGPGVELTNVGSGYATPPMVMATGGKGSGATFVATVNGIGQVTSVKITNPGRGYLAIDSPTLTFSSGVAGSGGVLTAVMLHVAGGSGGALVGNFVSQGETAYQLVSISVSNGGSGYSGFATAVFNTPPGGAPPVGSYWGIIVVEGAPSIQLTITNGVITAASIIANPSNLGNYYNDNAGFPTITVNTDPGYYEVSSVTINNGGSGYGPSAAIVVSGGSPSSAASFTPVISGGVIVEITTNYAGTYTTSTPPTLTVTDSAVLASGTITLAPFGIQGTTIETYAGHVWIANGAVVTFSAPGSVVDFSTGDGGGNFTSVDSFLRVGFSRLLQTSGFLYLIGDSSINYISGVQTTGTPPTTTFTNQNADPEVGTPYPSTVDVFSRNIVFANAFGAHVSYGAAVTKISDKLDGVYNTVPGFAGQQLSAAKAILFGRKCWILLMPIIDPVTQIQTNKLMIWDSKEWYTSQQDVNLLYIQHQEIASVITAWGTDGTSVYPLFSQPSAGFLKTVQSKLWDAPGGYQQQKAATRLWAMAEFLGSKNLSYTVTIDNEFGIPSPAGNAQATGSAVGFSWVNGSGLPFTWVNGSAQTFTWVVTGSNIIAVLPPTAVAQQGVLTGMTTKTMCDDMILISEMLGDEIVGYRG